jgi:hypothetical protein
VLFFALKSRDRGGSEEIEMVVTFHTTHSDDVGAHTDPQSLLCYSASHFSFPSLVELPPARTVENLLRTQQWPCLGTLTRLEIELISNSNTISKLTLAV